jgi:hypothetical protein
MFYDRGTNTAFLRNGGVLLVRRVLMLSQLISPPSIYPITTNIYNSLSYVHEKEFDHVMSMILSHFL